MGDGKKGEVGDGWACDWRLLLEKTSEKLASDEDTAEQPSSVTTMKPSGLIQLPPSNSPRPPAANLASTLLPVRINLITRGLPTPCARIYRLPTTSPTLRAAWLAVHPSNQPTTRSQRKKAAPPASTRDSIPSHIRQQRLAASLLEPPNAGGQGYPACPGEEDLIGFVTSGNYDLGAGKGMGVGCVMLGKVDLEKGDEESRLCIVRSAGLGVARLGRWEV